MAARASDGGQPHPKAAGGHTPPGKWTPRCPHPIPTGGDRSCSHPNPKCWPAELPLTAKLSKNRRAPGSSPPDPQVSSSGLYDRSVTKHMLKVEVSAYVQTTLTVEIEVFVRATAVAAFSSIEPAAGALSGARSDGTGAVSAEVRPTSKRKSLPAPRLLLRSRIFFFVTPFRALGPRPGQYDRPLELTLTARDFEVS